MEPLPESKVTFDGYRSWPEVDGQRWEVIDGHPFAMAGASVAHQELCSNFHFALRQHFAGKPCKVFLAPLDLRLSEHDVVQPDIMVVCDPSQLKRTHVDGPPSLVVEVVSPTSLRHDRVRKFRLYATAGVKEYWLLYPDPPMAEVHLLDGVGYRTHGVYTEKDQLVSATFADLVLDLSSLFPYVEVDEVKEVSPPYPSVIGA